MNAISSEYVYQNEAGELVTNSYLLAKMAGRGHSQVMRDLTSKGFIHDFVSVQNCTHTKVAVTTGNRGGTRKVNVIELNEYQTYVLTPYILGNAGFDMQKIIVAAFLDAREALRKIQEDAVSLAEAKQIAGKALEKYTDALDLLSKHQRPSRVMRSSIKESEWPMDAHTKIMAMYGTFAQVRGMCHSELSQYRDTYIEAAITAFEKERDEYRLNCKPSEFLLSVFQSFEDAITSLKSYQTYMARNRLSRLKGAMKRRGIEIKGGLPKGPEVPQQAALEV